MGEIDCHAILKRALSADEAGDDDQALDLYTKFVEMTLKVENPVSHLSFSLRSSFP